MNTFELSSSNSEQIRNSGREFGELPNPKPVAEPWTIKEGLHKSPLTCDI